MLQLPRRHPPLQHVPNAEPGRRRTPSLAVNNAKTHHEIETPRVRTLRRSGHVRLTVYESVRVCFRSQILVDIGRCSFEVFAGPAQALNLAHRRRRRNIKLEHRLTNLPSIGRRDQGPNSTTSARHLGILTETCRAHSFERRQGPSPNVRILVGTPSAARSASSPTPCTATEPKNEAKVFISTVYPTHPHNVSG